MSVVITDETFRLLETMHLYAERCMSTAHAEPHGTAGALRTTDDEDKAILHFNVLVSGHVCASEEGADPRNGLERIADERARQIDKGWTPEHDETHDAGELAYAAVVMATPPRERIGRNGWLEDWWPWPGNTQDMHNDSPTTEERRTEMVIAGAFCAAEIDRLTTLIEHGDD